MESKEELQRTAGNELGLEIKQFIIKIEVKKE